MSRFENKLRGRILDLVSARHLWWDVGHYGMILFGTNKCGNYSSPEPETWYYREIETRRSPITGYPRPQFQIIKDYTEFTKIYEPLSEDDKYSWHTFTVHEDGHELILGRRYWGEAFYGLSRHEAKLLRRYLRHWHRFTWFGLRTWLFEVSLHKAVNLKRPFACHVTPPRGAGGYSHWHCAERRRHKGEHRFRNYTWAGGDQDVQYNPNGVT